MKRYLFAGILGVSLACGQGASPKAYVAGQLIVQRASSADPDDVSKLFKTHGVSVKREIPSLKVHILTVAEPAADAVMKALAKSGKFTFVERDGHAHSSAIPNDPSYSSQWHLAQMNAAGAWGITTGSSGVTIAMVDSGVDATHPDLASRLIPGWSFLTGTTDTHDVEGHGTATAGTVAAATNNGIGVSGMTWGNPIMPLVVLSESDFASYSDIASAITYAADRGVRIINISIGGTSSSSALQSAVTYAWNKGAMVFSSAMNDGTSTPNYPAACDNAIAVSATGAGDSWSGFSNYGSWIDFSAPGVNILTTTRYGGTGYWSGTSFSSPLAAGVAALVLSVNPALSNAAVISLLQQSAVDLGTPGYDVNYGWGRIDAYAAVLAATTSRTVDSIPPAEKIATPAAGTTISGTVQIAGTATDNVGVSRVDLSIDGQASGSVTNGSFSFPWNTATVGNGAHTLTVRAYDAAGNTSITNSTVTVNNQVAADTTAPTAAVTSPAAGSYVNSAKPVAVTVKATDNVAVTQVCIYIDDVQVYSGTSAPYTYNWNTKKVAAGSHKITASAWDRAGNMSTSAAVTVTR